MKAIDIRKQLSPYKEGWIALDNNNKVVAHSKTLDSLSKKIKGLKKIVLIPASDNYKGYITSYQSYVLNCVGVKSYPYYIPQNDVILPWITVRLGFKKTHKMLPAPTMALLDTGADVCFVSDHIARYLGFSEKGKKIRKFRAANNEMFPTFPEKFMLYIAGKSHECQFYVSKTLPKGLQIILGTHGFFDRHQVCFDVQNNEIQIINNQEN